MNGLKEARHVFVYGTLLRGEPNHRLLARARFVATARTEPRFSLVDLGAFPAMLPYGDTTVAGEVYAVDSDTLAALDYLEGHPCFYRRTPVRLRGGARVETYVLQPGRAWTGQPIQGGDWREHRKEESERCGSES